MKRKWFISSKKLGGDPRYLQEQSNLKINEKAPVVQKSEIFINAEPGEIWAVLTDINRWPDWNDKILSAKASPNLKLESNFTWRTNGSKITSKVHTLVKNRSFGWMGKTFGAFAIHNWHFEPTERGTIVRVEESMEGWLIALMKKKMNIILKGDMAYWLQNLKRQCENQLFQ